MDGRMQRKKAKFYVDMLVNVFKYLKFCLFKDQVKRYIVIGRQCDAKYFKRANFVTNNFVCHTV